MSVIYATRKEAMVMVKSDDDDKQVHVHGSQEVPSSDNRVEGRPRRRLDGCGRHIHLCWGKPKYHTSHQFAVDQFDD